jgi:hypothetical protein
MPLSPMRILYSLFFFQAFLLASPGFCILLQVFVMLLISILSMNVGPWPLARAKQGYLVSARTTLASYSQAEPGHLCSTCVCISLKVIYL